MRKLRRYSEEDINGDILIKMLLDDGGCSLEGAMKKSERSTTGKKILFVDDSATIRKPEEYKIFPDFIPWIGVLMHGAREYTKYGMGCSSQEFILDSLKLKNPKRSLFLAYHLVFTSLLVFLPVIYDSYRILRDYR